MLLTDDGGSRSASVDFTIGDENRNKGLPVLFGEVICTLFVNDCEGLMGDGEDVVITEELKLKVGSEELVMGREIFGNTGTSISSSSGGLDATKRVLSRLILPPPLPTPEDKPLAADILKFG